MALLTSQQIRQIVRQPSVRVHYLSFDAVVAANVNAIAMALLFLPTRRYANDTLKISTHEPEGPFPTAAAYDENVVADVPDTPYLPATVPGGGVQDLELSLVTSGVELQVNLDKALRTDAGTKPDKFLEGSLRNAMRAEIENLTFNGAGGIQPVGFLNAAFPKQSIATAADQLASLDEAIMGINCGGGLTQCDYVFANRRACRRIADLTRSEGAKPTSMWIRSTTGKKVRVMAHSSPQGDVPIIPTDFIPTANDDTTTLIAVTCNRETGVHLALPEHAPEIRITHHRLDRRPSDYYIAEFKFALATLDTGKTVALTGFGV